MGNGMNKVLPGLYVGNYRDSKDHQQLDKYGITHIVAIHDSPRRLLPDKHYLCVMATDTPDQNLSQYFPVCNDFIHAARLREGNVLIHCLAGMSRSATLAVAYIMSATDLSWKDALKVVRAGRYVANPNAGFQSQLQEFETYRLAEERRRLRERFPSSALEKLDREKCKAAIDNYQELLQNKDICEGNCPRGEKCPTGAAANQQHTQRTDDSMTDDSDSSDAKTEQNDKEEDSTSCGGSGSGGQGGVSYNLSFFAEQWITTKHEKRLFDKLSGKPTEGGRHAIVEDSDDDGELVMENVKLYVPRKLNGIREAAGGQGGERIDEENCQ